MKKLAFYLEQQGCDYPEELPPLPEDLELELSNDWIHAHKADPDESFRTYNNNKSSNFLLNLLHKFMTSECFEVWKDEIKLGRTILIN